MNRKTLAVAVLATFGFVAVPVIVHSQSASGGTGSAGGSQQGGRAGGQRAGAGFQMAIQNLGKLKEHLQSAPHDFNGHRVDAIKAIDEAIKQLGLCEQAQQSQSKGQGQGQSQGQGWSRNQRQSGGLGTSQGGSVGSNQ